MMKKILGVLTAVVTAIAVVGVAWASSGSDTSTSVTSATDDSIASTSATAPDTSAPTTSQASTSTSQASTSTSIAATTSTSSDGSTSTSTGATTSTSLDNEDRDVPDSITTHVIPAVGSVTVQVSSGNLILVSVDAPGWAIEHHTLEGDRIRLRFTSGEAEGEFEARLDDGRVDVEIEVKAD